jgi:hypothetical protein
MMMTNSKDVEHVDARQPKRRMARFKAWFAHLVNRHAPVLDVDASGLPGTAGGVARLTADELALVRRDLRKVLDQHAESRRVMRYLRALEHALHKKGRHALEELQPDLLRRSLEQLDLLVSDRSLPGLSTLRSKAAISIAERERQADVRERSRQQQQARRHEESETEVEVEDSSHTTFLEVSDEWERSFTGQSGRTPLDEPQDASRPAHEKVASP